MSDPGGTLDVLTATPTAALDVAEHGAAPLPVAVPQAPLPAPVDEVATAVASLDAKMRYAEVIIRSSLVPKTLTHTGRGNSAVPLPIDQAVANVVVVMEYGQLLNLAPMIALSEINILEGKPGCSGKLMRAMLNKAGHDLIIHENTRQRAEVSIKLKDKPGSEKPRFSFDLDDALAAELIDNIVDGKARARSQWNKVLPWEAYTDAMLFERAMAKAIRALCPEVTMGISYTIEELDSMTRDLKPPEPEPESVWPHNGANSVLLRDERTAKRTLLDLCDGDKDKAGAVWDEHFDGRPVELLALGHMRQVLDLPAPKGDTSVTPPLPDMEEGGGGSEAADDAVTGNGTGAPAITAGSATDAPPSSADLAEWAKLYDKLGNDDVLGSEGIKEFQTWCREQGPDYRSTPRTAFALDAMIDRVQEMYRDAHGGPHQWDPAELEQIQADIKALRDAEPPEVWLKLMGLAFNHYANGDRPEGWTSDQRDKFVPWLMLGESKEAA